VGKLKTVLNFVSTCYFRFKYLDDLYLSNPYVKKAWKIKNIGHSLATAIKIRSGVMKTVNLCRIK